MDLTSKLQMKPGQLLQAVLMPESVASTLAVVLTDDDHEATALLVFVADRAALDDHQARIVEAANGGRLTWVSYPKAGQLGTDLNRDSLAALLTERGIEPVRQIAIDEVWSALRFQPVP
jgi:hypothetical protein